MEYLITIRQLRDRTYALRLGAVRSPELSLVHIVSNPLTFLSITKAVLRMNYKFQAHLFDCYVAVGAYLFFTGVK